MKVVLLSASLLVATAGAGQAACYSGYCSQGYVNPYSNPGIVSSDGSYRGRFNNNRYDPDSISNPYGRYGSRYSSDSLNNPYGGGNRYSGQRHYLFGQ